MQAPEQSPKSTKRHFTLADIIVSIKGDEDEPKVIHCNYIAQSRNPQDIYLPEEEDNEYPLDKISFEEEHHSHYITCTPLDEEDDEYLLDEILSKPDYDGVQWEKDNDTHFHVDMEREEA